MDAEFIRNRITALRIKHDISEYQMSFDLGHSRSYINNISSGKALPSLSEFLSICDFFSITPQVFFDPDVKDPVELQTIYNKIKLLSTSDINLILQLVNRL